MATAKFIKKDKDKPKTVFGTGRFFRRKKSRRNPIRKSTRSKHYT